MAKKKNINSLGIHRRAKLLRICHSLGLKDAPGWSNRDIIYALADARQIELGLSNIRNADIILAWFEAKEPEAIVKAPKRTARTTKGAASAILFNDKREFYKSWEWRTLRMQVLKEFGLTCQCCGATASDYSMSGQRVRICVDHIKPISKYWELRLERSNLQVLCDECNQGKGAWDESDYRTGQRLAI